MNTPWLIGLAGLYVSVLLLSLVWRGKEVSGVWLFLLRGFFPNWRFYHGWGHQPRLFVRVADSQHDWGEWVMFIPRQSFKWSQLLFNPQGNLKLSHQILVDHLSADLQGLTDPQLGFDLPTYHMVLRLARQLSIQQNADAQSFQFELRLLPPPDEPGPDAVVLRSPVLELAA